jgi:hypothetical protein
VGEKADEMGEIQAARANDEAREEERHSETIWKPVGGPSTMMRRKRA